MNMRIDAERSMVAMNPGKSAVDEVKTGSPHEGAVTKNP